MACKSAGSYVCLYDIVDLGLPLAALPFGDGLPGDAQRFGDLLLRVPRFFAQRLKPFCKLHVPHLLL